jgi:AraC-like DNA-binding protein
MSITLTTAGFFDLILRGGTAGLLMLVTVHLLRRPKWGALVATGVLFSVTGVIETLINARPVLDFLTPPAEVMLPLQQFHFIAMWWFVLALFDDRFCWHGRYFLPLAVTLPLVAGSSLATPSVAVWINAALIAFNGGLLVTMIIKALGDRASDLVDERRAFSRALAFTVPPFSLFVFGTNLISIQEPLNPMLCFVYATVYFLLALFFSFWLTSLKDGLFARTDAGQAVSTDELILTAADRLDLDRVIKAVDGGLYLEPGLTIGGLADVLQIPEHRLRKLINRGLGYRNFAAFINDYRITEAKRRLSDPGLAREQIIQHAFSLGYASLAPFNRAFRERVGVSPTEYREGALSGTAAE